MRGVTVFKWFTAEFEKASGRIVEPQSDAGPAIVGLALLKDIGARNTTPLDEEDAYLQLSRVRSDDEALQFLNRFGPLHAMGGLPFYGARTHRLFVIGTKRKVEGELFDDVLREGILMTAAINLAAAVADGDKKKLGQWIDTSHRNFDLLACVGDEAAALINVRRLEPRSGELWESLPIGVGEKDTKPTAVSLAKLAVKSLVNAEIKGKVSVVVGVTEKGKLATHAQPSDLISALWLQFAHSVDAGVTYRQCEAPGCAELMPLAPPSVMGTGGRKDRRTCSDACRARLMRHRAKRN